MKAAAGIATGTDWHEALDSALNEAMSGLQGAAVDLALLFASSDYALGYPELVATAQNRLGAGLLIGCSGQGVIGNDREVEGEPALSVLAFSLPGAYLSVFQVRQSDIQDDAATHAWLANLSETAPDVHAWIILADPFSFDSDALLTALSQAYPGMPLIGGLASGDFRLQKTDLFVGGEVVQEGAIVLALGGPYTVQTVVAQGAEPIGEPWTITGSNENLVETLGMRPALEIMIETLQSLPPDVQVRAQRNLLVGLAMNEYKDEFHRGDYLVRNILGVNQEEGWIAVGARPVTGQTLQFHMRDPKAADTDLLEMLTRARGEEAPGSPIGALLCACNGRGVGLFGTPDHDARMIRDVLDAIPLAGFFCNGEIGPVGGKPFLHGYTASIAVIRPLDA
ncbi:MAG TPA: FIST N-terminal domain-containing protein [Dehalococcoidia bacterium]|nr:FIST N-terminal domain-containing protein [Dehalococcoidia bacterium]